MKTAKRVQKAIAKLTDTPIDMQTEDVAADTTASPSREEREKQAEDSWAGGREGRKNVDGALPVRKAMNYSALQWRAKTVCMVVCSDIARYATYHALSATMGSRHNKKLSYR